MKTFKQIYNSIFGEPIWTEDFDGEVRKSRLKRINGGKVIVRSICGWIVANDDGTVPNLFQYVKRWFPR